MNGSCHPIKREGEELVRRKCQNIRDEQVNPTDRQTQTDRWTDRQTQTDGWTDRQTDRRLSDSTHHQQLSKAKEVKESPCMRSLCLVMSGCSLVVTVEEDGHTHHYQQHYEVLDWRVALVTK